MNAHRRSRLKAIAGTLRELQAALEEIRDEEQGAFDNMPESLQSGKGGQKSQEAITSLDDAQTLFEDTLNFVEAAKA